MTVGLVMLPVWGNTIPCIRCRARGRYRGNRCRVCNGRGCVYSGVGSACVCACMCNELTSFIICNSCLNSYEINGACARISFA
jgi:hypothetical protein